MPRAPGRRGKRARSGGEPTVSGCLSICHDPDLLGLVLPVVLPHLDELVVVDGAYEWMAAWHEANGQRPAVSLEAVDRIAGLSRVPTRILTGTWPNEPAKRAAGYAACTSDLVFRIDADEFIRLIPDEVARFAASGALAAEMEVPLLVAPGWILVGRSRAFPALPRVGALFRRSALSPRDHLRYLWLVSKADWGMSPGIDWPERPWPEPVAVAAHLTGWRTVETARNRAAFYVLDYARTRGLPWHEDLAGRPVPDAGEVLAAVGVEAMRDLLDATDIVSGVPRLDGGALLPAGMADADTRLLDPWFAAFLDSHRERNRNLRRRGSFLAGGAPFHVDVTGPANLAAIAPGGVLELELTTGTARRAAASLVTLRAEPPWEEEAPLAAETAGSRIRIPLPDAAAGDDVHLRRGLVLRVWPREGILHRIAFR